ncbi:MAG TPA: hypothetical protein DIT99_20850 [Candidatus Latescibacteria bacterium]|nr:hypothetical protein [Candidatus Latescibacterota bacterium]
MGADGVGLVGCLPGVRVNHPGDIVRKEVGNGQAGYKRDTEPDRNTAFPLFISGQIETAIADNQKEYG